MPSPLTLSLTLVDSLASYFHSLFSSLRVSPRSRSLSFLFFSILSLPAGHALLVIIYELLSRAASALDANNNRVRASIVEFYSSFLAMPTSTE
ncbi:hypothetical protein BU24DRAFT_235073 [Aaosphaeria arxii CBS 175.79]|uniref:Uncharacterized protein n=1 Tax=Aaosphaeria arxii CBS 175.79 TaxID=1450172 RepID=A0A6A5XKG4_9PLEO|nr:uncharacterized protein BU24DRAFT_235073 [Aaosphaeria arxii CBS 175.79]KAF2013341.1 hypothetical protein BU24DRAFT_235073 [Aaosphaeria arxii CBS 175.79]